jgi:hypothetical protein
VTAAGARRSLAHALAGAGRYPCGPLGPGASTGFLRAPSLTRNGSKSDPKRVTEGGAAYA